jgi:hypothetical protein
MDLVFDNSISFEERCRIVLDYQLDQNPVYKIFFGVLGVQDSNLVKINDIPLLPVRAFKDTKLLATGSGDEKPDLIFRSSGTGSMNQSIHYVSDASVYINAVERGFYRYFPKNEYAILSYTPGYADNPDSSLVWMLDHLIKSDSSGLSKFLTLNRALKSNDYCEIRESGKKVLLFGAAFGLLDLLDLNSEQLPEGSEIIETGGMKTHRREMSKEELRKLLSTGFKLPLDSIHSEYGMCELLSQSYAIGGEWFSAPHWMRVTIRKAEDPLQICKPGEAGKIGIIDLANVYSCPFLLTDDMGVMNNQNSFKVLGRWKNSDLRGCNFLIDTEL